MTNSERDKLLFITLSHHFDNFIKFHYHYARDHSKCTVESLIVDSHYPASKEKRNSFMHLMKSLISVVQTIQRFKPNLIVSSHPVSGTILMIYFKTFRPYNTKWIHWFTGQVWATKTGLKRFLYRQIDVAICEQASLILCDSKAQLEYLHNNGFHKFSSLKVVGKGSICGADEELFLLNINKKIEFSDIRLGYVGRINSDKGILQLMAEFNRVDPATCSLNVYGEIDEKSINDEFFNLIQQSAGKISYKGHITSKKLIYSDIDILILPSYREGFSNVLIEAQAAGIPVIVRNIYGVRDSYVEMQSGLSFINEAEIFSCVDKMTNDPIRFHRFQVEAKKFVLDNFCREKILKKTLSTYLKFIKTN